MNIIAKPVQTEQINNGQYELFTTVEMTDVNGEPVQVLQSIGHYSIAQLENEKANLENAIASIDAKISAIESLQ